MLSACRFVILGWLCLAIKEILQMALVVTSLLTQCCIAFFHRTSQEKNAS